MNSLLRRLVDSVREDLGHPATLIRLLEEKPDLRVSLDPPVRSISAESVVRWENLGRANPLHWPRREQGTLMGWKLRGDHDYGSFTLRRPEYAVICQRTVTDDWTCDITDVHGFASSKSELQDFVSTDLMVETNSRNLIDEITQDKLAENLAHREIRIIHSPGSDYFLRCAWDGRVFLVNGGGSHHLAAAKYIAARLPQAVPLRGKLYTYSLNSLAIASMQRDFELFVISDDTPIWAGFCDAMRAYQATWLWHEMPSGLESARAVLLPRAERRSMKVASLLRRSGVADLGAHLAQLAGRSFIVHDRP